MALNVQIQKNAAIFCVDQECVQADETRRDELTGDDEMRPYLVNATTSK
jgi:hypothetical protein